MSPPPAAAAASATDVQTVQEEGVPSIAVTNRAMTKLVVALTFLALAHGVRFGTFTASGPDSYGYVSQADLWLKGTLIIAQPLHDEFSWRWANMALSPLGYVPGEIGGTMVPIYSPGLPLLMAAFKALGGEPAVYLVVPLLGALAVWLTYRLGLKFGDGYVAALASVALLVSPIFLSRLVWPMSDVPAMAWWLAAIVLAAEPSMARTSLAGGAAAAAILTRPNLLPLALLVGLFILMRRRSTGARLSHAAVFTLAMLPGPIAVAVINNHLYGSPFTSGYGPVDTIYATRYFFTNLLQYPTWIVTQTPFILLALAAPFLLRRAGRREVSHLSVFGLIFFAGVLLLYLWYTPFEDPEYLRFLLPGYPLMLAAAAAAFDQLAPTAPRRRRTAFAAVALIVVVYGVWHGRSAFRTRGYEARYRAAAQIAATLPENAVFLSNLHSGSLRYYAHRLTLRFEWLAPDVFVTALEQLRNSGRPVFVVLDGGEREAFRARYAPVADVSWLDRPPTLIAAKRVFFYQLWPPADDRATVLRLLQEKGLSQASSP
jgi:4-amino-4-deoxy-L-arabinose transferase-like glycosyltransferase